MVTNVTGKYLKMKIHILGICGTFMGGLAQILVEKGHIVSGSDKQFYPPMSDQLKSLGVQMIEGYEESDLPCADLIRNRQRSEQRQSFCRIYFKSKARVHLWS